MQPISFFDDPQRKGRAREDVRLNQLGLFVYEDGRRVAIGFNLTPFAERPSLEVTATNAQGDVAGSMTIIEALSPNFNLTMHLREGSDTGEYEIEVVVYYKDDEGQRTEVDRKQATIDINRPGEQIVD